MIVLGLLATAAVEVALATAALGGCGRRDAARESAVGDPVAGAEVFVRARCGDCHTLAAAGAQGRLGPNLDRHAARHVQTFREVVEIVAAGPGAMPAFGGRLDEEEIRDVAAFVVVSSGTTREP